MTRTGRRTAWALSLGLAAAGGLAAHVLAYRLAEPDADARAHLLEETGHSYLDVPLVASFCLALAVVGFVARVLAGACGPGRPPLWLFALAPPLGFVVQEHAERMLHHEALLSAALEPAFVVGLVLQLPFALAAYLVAHALLVAAGALARRLDAPPRPAPVPEAGLALPGRSWIPDPPAVIGGRGQRAPPPAVPA